VTAAAARAVGALGGPDDGVRLVPLLGHENRRVRFEALRAIGRLGCRASAPDVVRLLDSLRGLPRVEKLDYDLPLVAIRLLGEWESGEAVPVLVRVVNGELGLRSAALDALCRIRSVAGAVQLVPTLDAAFADRHADDLALKMLDLVVLTDCRAALPVARRYLGHPNRALRARAVEAVGAWADAESADAVRALCFRDGSDFVRPAAARALARILGPAAAPDLESLAREINPAMRTAVCELLAAVSTGGPS
jgi:HEAT repeat protein